jgi:hypothetical protein
MVVPSQEGIAASLTFGEGKKMGGRISRRLAGCVVSGLMLLGVALRADADLVVNGGFETGDFTGWTTSIDATFDGVDALAPHDGTYAAYFGNPSGTSSISQTLATTAGAVYQVAFWLAPEMDVLGASTPNQFQFDWDGAPRLTLTDAPGSAYAQHTFLLTASSASTTLTFSFANSPAFWDFDTVSVTAASVVPEPGSLALVALACALVAYTRRART